MRSILTTAVADLTAAYARERQTFIYFVLPLFCVLFIIMAFCAFPMASTMLTGALALSALLGWVAGAVGVRLERWLMSQAAQRPTPEMLALEAGRRAEMAEEARWAAVPVMGAFPAPPCLDIDGGTVTVAPAVIAPAPEAPVAKAKTPRTRKLAVAALPTVAAPEAPALSPAPAKPARRKASKPTAAPGKAATDRKSDKPAPATKTTAKSATGRGKASKPAPAPEAPAKPPRKGKAKGK